MISYAWDILRYILDNELAEDNLELERLFWFYAEKHGFRENQIVECLESPDFPWFRKKKRTSRKELEMQLFILNFAHPITDEQLEQIRKLTGFEIVLVKSFPVHFDTNKFFVTQVDDLVDVVSEFVKTIGGWNVDILINPPSLSSIAVPLLRSLDEAAGRWLPIIKLKRDESSLGAKFIVDEIL